jgi:CRISPR system Cascade subunit CasC
MTRFVQLHFLMVYPPSNPNRDDQGQPKQAEFGGVPRLRISSQAIKRAARRTQRFGEVVYDELLTAHGASEDRAGEIARQVADIFGALKSAKDKTPRYIEQLAFISPDERTAALDLAKRLLDGETVGKRTRRSSKNRSCARPTARSTSRSSDGCWPTIRISTAMPPRRSPTR